MASVWGGHGMRLVGFFIVEERICVGVVVGGGVCLVCDKWIVRLVVHVVVVCGGMCCFCLSSILHILQLDARLCSCRLQRFRSRCRPVLSRGEDVMRQCVPDSICSRQGLRGNRGNSTMTRESIELRNPSQDGNISIECQRCTLVFLLIAVTNPLTVLLWYWYLFFCKSFDYSSGL